jgi:biopolymer transport protein ExbD
MGVRLSGGGGASRYTVTQNSEINVTPFVDIMLVLLIIFMVSIPTATTAIKIDMPPANGGQPGKDPVFISVMGPDAIYIAGQKTTLATMDADLRTALQSQNPHDERVLVRGDKDIEYQDFLSVLNSLKASGYTRVALINEDTE